MRRLDALSIWVAGGSLIFLVTGTLVVQVHGQRRVDDGGLQKVIDNNAALEQRVETIEKMRIDARLSVVESIASRLERMETQGAVNSVSSGGMLVFGILNYFGNRPRRKREREDHNDD